MIDYTFTGSSSEGPISGEVQQARTDVLNLQNSVNNANSALSNIWDNTFQTRQDVTAIRTTDKEDLETEIRKNNTEIRAEVNGAKDIILRTMEQYKDTEEERFRSLYAVLHSELDSIAQKVEYIEGVVNLIQTKLNSMETKLNEYIGSSSASDNRDTIIHAIANMQRQTMQSLSTVPFEQKNFIENGTPYYIYGAVDTDSDGACSGDHRLLQVVEATAATIGAACVSIRSIVSSNHDILERLEANDSEAAEDVLAITCFVWENVLRMLFTDDVSNYSGSANLVKGEEGWSSYISDNASLPMVSSSLVRIPRKLVRYGYFKGVFPNPADTYYYSEELSKILASPWRTIEGYGGSF